MPLSLASEHAIMSVFHYSVPSDGVEDGVAVRLERLVDLLEQYFHPSNGGRWTSSLSRFLRHLMENFMKRLALDASKPRDSFAASKDALRPTEEQRNPRLPMSSFLQSRFLHALLRMAGRAQYSKDNTMMETACGMFLFVPSYVSRLPSRI